MKKIISTILISIILVSFIGCGGSDEQSQSADEKFLQDLANGLEARWKISDNSTLSYDEAEWDAKLVDAELKEIGVYSDADFEDKNLQTDAYAYIDLLHQQEEALDYYYSEYNLYEEKWFDAYDKRSQLLVKFMDEYGLQVSNEYQDTIDEMYANAKTVTAQDSLDTAIEQATFAVAEDAGGGWNTYSTVIKNIAGVEFKTFQLSINLLDEQGNILETVYSSVENWKAEQSATFEFFTEKEFADTEISTYYEVSE